MIGQTVVETPDGWLIRCEACGHHSIPKAAQPNATWTFNGDLIKPTFTPSMNECSNPREHKDYRPDCPTRRCHFILTDGVMRYCGDCTHKLANHTVPLQPWSEVQVRYYEALMQEHKAKG